MTRVELVDAQGTLLREIADPRMKRDTVALTYAFALRQSFDPRSRDVVDFATVNRAIMERWSVSALKYIKTKAWRIYGGEA
jgi:hypothetical protein